MATSRFSWCTAIACAFSVCASDGAARAQARRVRIIDLSATVTEADVCDFNRLFGEVYVVDFNRSPLGTQLHVYDLDFNHLRDVTMASPPGFSAPEGSVRDPVTGDFLFPSWNAHVIRRFTAAGAFVSEFPTGFRATGLTYDTNNRTVWCAACCPPGQGIVAQFALDGTRVSSFNLPANRSPVGLAFDPLSDTLFISENGDDHVDEYTKNGVFLQQFIGPGPYPGNGLGISYDPLTGDLYYGGQTSRVLVFNDRNRRTMAGCTFRNGSGSNPVGYACATTPVLGTSWQSRIPPTPTVGSSTLATVLVVGIGGPTSGTFLGGFEVLLGGPFVTDTVVGAGAGSHSIPVPATPSLARVPVFTQGARIESLPGGGTTAVLLNAQDLVLGF